MPHFFTGNVLGGEREGAGVFEYAPLRHITRGYARCPAVHSRRMSRAFLAAFSKIVGGFADMDKLLAKHGKQVSLRPSYDSAC